MEAAVKTKWIIDPTHSEVHFKVKHLVISTVTGTFKSFAGSMESENEDFKNAKALIALGNASEEIQNSIKPKLRIRDFKRIIHLIIPET